MSELPRNHATASDQPRGAPADVGQLDREASQAALRCDLGPDLSCASFSNRVRWPLLALLAALSVVLGVLATQLPWGGMSADREESLHASFSAYSSYFGALALVVLASMCICSERPVPEEVQAEGGFVASRCQFGRDCRCCATRGNRIRWWLGGTAIFVGAVLLAAGAVPQGSWSGTCDDCHDVFQILLEAAAMLLAPGLLLVLSTACCAELPIVGHRVRPPLCSLRARAVRPACACCSARGPASASGRNDADDLFGGVQIAQAAPNAAGFKVTDVARVITKPPTGADAV